MSTGHSDLEFGGLSFCLCHLAKMCLHRAKQYSPNQTQRVWMHGLPITQKEMGSWACFQHFSVCPAFSSEEQSTPWKASEKGIIEHTIASCYHFLPLLLLFYVAATPREDLSCHRSCVHSPCMFDGMNSTSHQVPKPHFSAHSRPSPSLSSTSRSSDLTVRGLSTLPRESTKGRAYHPKASKP